MKKKMKAIFIVIVSLWGSHFIISSIVSDELADKQIFRLSIRTTCEIYQATPNKINHTLDAEMQHGRIEGGYYSINEKKVIGYFKNREIKMIVIKREAKKKAIVILIKKSF